MERWRTPLGKWVRRYGAAELAHELGLGAHQPTKHRAQAVYQWISGRTVPRPDHALRIVSLSRGKVRLEDIYAQREALLRGPQTRA